MKRYILYAVLALAVVSLVGMSMSEYFNSAYVRNTLKSWGTLEVDGASTFDGSATFNSTSAFSGAVTQNSTTFLTAGYVALSNDSLTLPNTSMVYITGDSGGVVHFTIAAAGRIVTISTVDSAEATIVDGGILLLAGDANLNATKKSTITLISDGTNWLEVARALH